MATIRPSVRLTANQEYIICLGCIIGAQLAYVGIAYLLIVGCVVGG